VEEGRTRLSPTLKIGSGLMDKTARLLARALDYRAKRHGVIAGNLANIDTPGYRPKDIEFDEVLREALNEPAVKLRITNPAHMRAGSWVNPSGESEFPIHELPAGPRGESEVDLDREMTKMAKNNLMYEATVKMLAKKFDELKAVIEEGRR